MRHDGIACSIRVRWRVAMNLRIHDWDLEFLEFPDILHRPR